MRTRLLMAATTTAVLVAGCTSPAGPTSPAEPGASTSVSWAPVASAVVLPTEAGFDYADPGEVCRRFLAALYSADTVRDGGPADAYRRAAAYADTALAAQVGAARRDGRWATWVEHQARLVAEVAVHVDVHQHPDSTVEAERAFRVTVTPIGADGWRGWTEHSVVYCTARRDAGGWRVAAFDVYPVRPR